MWARVSIQIEGSLQAGRRALEYPFGSSMLSKQVWVFLNSVILMSMVVITSVTSASVYNA